MSLLLWVIILLASIWATHWGADQVEWQPQEAIISIMEVLVLIWGAYLIVADREIS